MGTFDTATDYIRRLIKRLEIIKQVELGIMDALELNTVLNALRAYDPIPAWYGNYSEEKHRQAIRFIEGLRRRIVEEDSVTLGPEHLTDLHGVHDTLCEVEIAQNEYDGFVDDLLGEDW